MLICSKDLKTYLPCGTPQVANFEFAFSYKVKSFYKIAILVPLHM